ncbi:TraR/DksA family transcriptional regulator [Arsenophonus nasoniae]|uniref:TraR/DksA family transcriptional regulator n=1 Tax=Arsenophonus nasoniae TaxID=638 RepID=A0AA95GCS7_9GAMM|nr:TraR/DksA family transcriptional regulator [Arsenophonus nasoniae]WGL94645.1 TraR/DksA family transcriptional regulator [Arsenophonus nasoniae]WGL96681.1 TraR/DksA family transcriptional regulator [Arsenophonus nasoniae]
MSDQIDRANDIAQQLLIRQIKQATHHTNSLSAFICEDCDKPILEARRNASPGCIRCIDCQTIYELKQKHYRSV